MPNEHIIKPDNHLTDEEVCGMVDKWRESVNDPAAREKFELAFLLVLGAGLRVSETVSTSLHPTQNQSYCQIVDGPEGPQARLYLFGCKGKGGGKKGRTAEKRHRMAQVIPELVPQFIRRYERRLAEGHTLLFSRPDGSPYTVLTFQNWWYDLMKLCGIERGRQVSKWGNNVINRPSIHEGRHTYATFEIASRRLNAEEVACQLGNSPEITRTEYQHAIMEMIYLNDKRPQWHKMLEAQTTARSLRLVG